MFYMTSIFNVVSLQNTLNNYTYVYVVGCRNVEMLYN